MTNPQEFFIQILINIFVYSISNFNLMTFRYFIILRQTNFFCE